MIIIGQDDIMVIVNREAAIVGLLSLVLVGIITNDPKVREGNLRLLDIFPRTVPCSTIITAGIIKFDGALVYNESDPIRRCVQTSTEEFTNCIKIWYEGSFFARNCFFVERGP